jgi:hypothetical protein
LKRIRNELIDRWAGSQHDIINIIDEIDEGEQIRKSMS